MSWLLRAVGVVAPPPEAAPPEAVYSAVARAWGVATMFSAHDVYVVAAAVALSVVAVHASNYAWAWLTLVLKIAAAVVVVAAAGAWVATAIPKGA